MSHYNHHNANPHPNYAVPTVLAAAHPNPNHTNISIADHSGNDDTHHVYDVTFYSHSIRTTVTSNPTSVDAWINGTNYSINHIRHVIVGLDVEWRPNFSANSNNPVATLQLCVGHSCLVFQILHAPYIPHSLASFLADARVTLVGVGIKEDVEKLMANYALRVGNFADLRDVAADRYWDRELKNTGLKTLSLRFLGLEVKKPKRVTMSKWDSQFLTHEQVQYACVDAFVSYEIGFHLMGS